MDIQIPFIFVSLFSLASVLLIFIYKFGIKEKSYEEALAEQRKQTHILLGIKPKLKEKKTKKPSKKIQPAVKEKVTSQDNEVVEQEQPEPAQKNSETQKKPHVEFKEDTEDVCPKTVTIKKQAKKDKVRPILIHKENEVENLINTDGVTSPANHFEELHPKDDFELFRSVEETSKDVVEKIAEAEPLKPVQKKIEVEVVQIQKDVATVSTAPPINGFIGNTGKEKKKKKSEFNSLQQQLAGDTNGPNMTVLLNLVRKAELSRSEVQLLIDLLLNKQHEAPAIVDEWSEGKSDPVQKLKKQLAEKEKLLVEQQQVVAGTQAKLKEIRAEYQNEKSNLLQKIRNLEEMMHGKQLEASMNLQQVQQLQAQIQEDVVKYHKLREEHTLQRQQFEIRLSQTQESEAIINQLQNELQEISSMNNKLRMDFARLTEENMAEKERNQTLIVQLNNFQKELEQKNERNRQLEENRVKLEHNLESVLKKENDLTMEVSRLNTLIQQQNEEIRRLEHNTNQYHEDLQKQKDDSNKIINQLTMELRQAQEENVQIKMTHMNGSLQESKQREIEILNLHNELASVNAKLSQTEKQSEKELKAATALAENLQQQMEQLKVQFNEERLKLEEQKMKNNELREKNWKVMEALNAAEGKLKNNKSAKTKSDEEIQREFIQRLFPEIKDREIADAELFKMEGESFLKKYVENLRRESVKNDADEGQQLKMQLHHYKNVIDNTEKMLNKLQKHIEQEEINWRMQLAAKENELESAKENYRQELQEKVAWFEVNLKKEQEEKKRIIAQYQEAQSSAHSVH